MKKILRLVTTSVLTLTLVACGGQSSASSQPSTQSSSTGTTSSSSAYAAVSVISISADSSSLTQVSGATKKVTVTAKFDSAADPATKLEWYVNNVKDSQTGKTFDYEPSAEGEYKIVAKVGSVASNEILVKVSQAGVAPSEFAVKEPKVIDADTIEIEGDSGASVVVKGHDLKDTSRYSLSEGKYIIELAKVLAQGEEVQITLKKGDKEVVKSFVYDLQKLVVASVGGLVAKADGSYEVVKPFKTSTADVAYAIAWSHKEFVGNYATEFSATAPAGVEAMSGSVGTQAFTNATVLGKTFVVNRDTVPGTYTFKYKVGSKESVATIVVKDPVAAIAFNQKTISEKKYDVTLGKFTDGGTAGYDAAGEWAPASGVAAGADGSYKITKPYLATETKEFAFSFNVKNIDIIDALNVAGNTATPNRVQFAVSGPKGAVIFTDQANHPQFTNLMVSSMRDSDDFVGYVAKIDSKTDAGTYTITANVYEGATIVLTKEVKVVIENPEAELELQVNQLDDASKVLDPSEKNGQVLTPDASDDSLYVIAKPGDANYDKQNLVFNAILENYESANSISSSQTTTFTSGAIRKDLLVYKTSAAGPQTIEGYNRNSYLGVELGIPFPNSYQAWEAAIYAADAIVFQPTTGKYYKANASVAATDIPGKAAAWVLYTSWADNQVNAAGKAVYKDGLSYLVKTATVNGDTWAEISAEIAPADKIPVYSNAATYALGDVVEYSSKFYKNTTAITSAEAWTVAHWAEVAATDVVAIAVQPKLFALGETMALDALALYGGKIMRVTTAVVAEDSPVAAAAKLGSTIKVVKNNGGEQISNNAATPALGKASFDYFTSGSADIALGNLFALEISNLTSTGDYVYSVSVGELTKTITVRVVEPVVSADFKVASLTGVTATNLAKMQAKDEYTVTCVGNGAGACGILGTLDFTLYNTKLATSPQDMSYGLEVTTPLQYNKYEEAIAVTEKNGVDGHVESVALLTKAYNADGKDGTKIDITDAGDYHYSLTIGGQSKSFVIHAVKNASLNIKSVLDTKAHLFLEEAKGSYLISEPFTEPNTFDLDIAVSGANLPSSKLYYCVTATAAAPADDTAAKELVFKDGVAVIPHAWVLAAGDKGDKSVYIWLYPENKATAAKLVGVSTQVSLYNLIA